MEHTNNFMEGKVSAKLLGFFFPMLLTNILQQIYSVTDTAIVGKGLGDYALGAVGNLSSLSLLIIGFSTGMANGFAVIIAQNYGAGNHSVLRKSIAISVKLSIVLTLILTAAGCLMLKPILLFMQTDKVILQDSLKYGYIIFGGLAAAIAYNLCSGILRSLGDSKTPFIAIMFSSAVNIALDCILILILHTGVEGAAIATILSQVISSFICFCKIRQMPVIQIKAEDFKNDIAMYLLLLKNGIPMACMNSVTAVGCMIVQSYVNDCGVAYTSAYSVCSKYLNLFMLPSLTAGFSISAFVSQNYGAGKVERIKKGVHVCLLIALISYVLLGLVMAFLPELLAGFMLSEEETISLAVEYLKICGAALILVNLLFVYRNSVQGMGYPLIPMLSGITEMVLRIPAIILLMPEIGFKATAYAEAAAWIGALTLNWIAYRIFYIKIK
ncbi:MAG: MATE family efflux transporter [Ruminococcus sp.]|nr:MATE family efflux transporter [Ruminococcus sp.]